MHEGVERVRPSLLAIAERGGRHGNCTLGIHTPTPAEETASATAAVQVWRPCFGWVPRTIDAEQPARLQVAS